MRRFAWLLAVIALAALGVLTIHQPETASAQPTFDQDCLSYDPNNLSLVSEGDNWVLMSGSSRMKVFFDRDDAERGMQVARAHTQQCFIGRDNTRPDRQRYIFEYWQGDSGIDVTLPTADCLSYDRNNLTLENLGATGWRVNSGSQALLLLDNQEDAENAQELLGMHDRLCYIGRDVTASNREDYIMTYLISDTVPLVPIDPGIVEVPEFDPDTDTLIPDLPPAFPAPGGPGTGPAPEDCIPYDPAALTIQDASPDGYVLSSGASNMLLLDTQPDAQIAQQVAQDHTEQCFIGRGNSRSNRQRYIVEYWKGDSGMGVTPPRDDCLTYDPATLNVVDAGASGWQVTSGPSILLLLDTQADALLAQNVLQGYDQLCFIGRGNSRANSYRYIHTYRLNSTAGTGPIATIPPAATVPPATPDTSPECAGAPAPRMIVGEQGRVTFTTGTPVNVRTGPGLGYDSVAQLPEGALFDVTSGPTCAEGYYWWSVRTDTGLTGWMAEGIVGNYFIEPLP